MMQSQNMDDDNKWEDFSRLFSEYLQTQENTARLTSILETNKTRFPIDLDKIRALNSELADVMIKDPIKCMRVFQPRLQLVCEDLRHSNSSMNDGATKKKLLGKKSVYSFNKFFYIFIRTMAS